MRKKLKREKGLLFYVIGYFFYIDGVYTIISMATINAALTLTNMPMTLKSYLWILLKSLINLLLMKAI